MHFKTGKYIGVDCCFVNSDYLRDILKVEEFTTDSKNRDLMRDIQYQLEIRDRTRNHFSIDKIDIKKQAIWNKEHGVKTDG